MSKTILLEEFISPDNKGIYIFSSLINSHEKWTTTLSLQDMLRSIIDHLQLQELVTVRI